MSLKLLKLKNMHLDYFENYFLINSQGNGYCLQKNIGNPPSSTSYGHESSERTSYENHKRMHQQKIIQASTELIRLNKSELERVKIVATVPSGQSIETAELNGILDEIVGIISKKQFKELKIFRS